MRITKASLTTENAALRAELKRLQGKRDDLVGELFPEKKSDNDLRIIEKAEGLTTEELFMSAAEDRSFVTYGACAQSLGLGDRFLPSMMKDVLSYIEEYKIDHLVVNRRGQYGAGAPLKEHHAKLRDLGYSSFPEQGSRRKKKAKKKDDITEIARITAAVVAAMRS